MHKLVIVKPGCKEFGNELLNHMSIYAYGLETGARVVNRSAFGYPGLFRIAHALYARYLGWKYPECSLKAWRAPIFLPPTKSSLKLPSCDMLYFFGWVFRNPLGLKKYRDELLAIFGQAKHVSLPPLPVGYLRIGVHLRQKPFPGFPQGDFLVPADRVRQIIDDYVQQHSIDRSRAELFIVSDTPIPGKIFAGYAYQMVYGSTETNLFLLSHCSVVIGTNTTFSNLAAWFGNVPHIVTDNGPIDWELYKGKTAYFENAYATFAY